MKLLSNMKPDGKITLILISLPRPMNNAAVTLTGCTFQRVMLCSSAIGAFCRKLSGVFWVLLLYVLDSLEIRSPNSRVLRSWISKILLFQNESQMHASFGPPDSATEEDMTKNLSSYEYDYASPHERSESEESGTQEKGESRGQQPSTSSSAHAEFSVVTVPVPVKKEIPKPKPVIPSHHFYELPEKKEKRLKALYKSLDINGDGKVDIKDMTAALETQMPHVPHASKSAKQIMARADKNKSSDLDFAEFVHYVLEHEKNLAVVFKDLDRNKDGVIDVQEVKNYCQRLGISISDAEAWRLIYKMDVNGTATIDLEEFQHFLLFCPSADPLAIARFWRHNLVIDIGDDTAVPEDFSERELKTGIWWRHLLAGAVAGTVSRTCTAPLDRLKVYLQVHASRTNTIRVLNGIRFLLKEGGLRSLWRGNGVNVIKIAPESAVKFMAYEQIKRFIAKTRGGKRDITMVERFLAGSCAGAVAQTCIYPLEVLKTRLALRKTGELNRGVVNATVQLYRLEGLKTFYRGYVPNLCGIIPYAGIDLAIYETLKSLYLRRNKDKKEPGVLALLACGTCSSTCGQLASYPLALVRTRLQARAISNANQPDSMVGQFQYILRNEGVSGLYRGITPNFMKVLPAVGISYVVYETVRKQLGVQMT